MTNRRNFLKQLSAAGIAGSFSLPLFAADHDSFFSEATASVTGKLYVGWGRADTTPEKPVALTGQKYKRISQQVQDPLMATVLALETRDGKGVMEQAIMVSCDLLNIREKTQKRLQEAIAGKLPGFDPAKLFLNAIHTHTAPGVADDEFGDLYDTSDDPGVMTPSRYETFFIDRVTEAVVQAWQNRKPGGFSWGLGHAFLGHNRRVVRFSGKAQMYGAYEQDFSHYEGTEDIQIPMLFFWNQNRELTGMVINSTATAQVTDGTRFISADFYQEVRENIRKKYGDRVFAFFQLGAAGDITPASHEYIYQRAENEMLKRKGITSRQELANRMVKAIDEVFPYVREDISEKVIFRHTVAQLELPEIDPPNLPFHKADPVKPTEIHVIRLDDIAIATNPFELFVDYGLMIKAKSKAILTFIVELSCRNSGYLPTARARQGGGYSAENILVGPEGGIRLVEETVKQINQLWEDQ